MPYSPSGEREPVPLQEDSPFLVSDAALLQHFLDLHDESAFATLVERHGPMVLATCRRQLGNSSDADDAFQATFLVLARKAGSITKRNHVGPWLYRVACLTSGKLRLAAQRQRLRDQQVRLMPEPSAAGVASVEVRDELALLDQAMAELPEKLRVPLVLCELQGVSRREAASHLQISEGTLSSPAGSGACPAPAEAGCLLWRVHDSHADRSVTSCPGPGGRSAEPGSGHAQGGQRCRSHRRAERCCQHGSSGAGGRSDQDHVVIKTETADGGYAVDLCAGRAGCAHLCQQPGWCEPSQG
ncbi:MAG: sigma-70 family RNA polymerase sigma factor [Gemmatales bacterium]